MISRRSFIEAAATVGAALTLPGFSFPSRRERQLGVALVGLGYYSTDLLAPALQLTKNCYLAGIVTGTPSKAEAWQARYKIPGKNIYNYEQFDEIANNDSIDVVYVVLPPSMHAEYSIKAANAGKHVWCEKPMAMTVRECEQMIGAARRNGVKLSIGYRMQHEPNTQEIIRYRREARYGRVLSIRAEAGYYDGRSNHWKQKKEMGGGAMYDMGVYPLNAARYSTGLEPVAVMARASTTRPEIYTEVEETMHFQLDFPDGITAECQTSFGKGMNDLHVTCTDGWYSLAPFQAYSGIRGRASDGTILDKVIPNQQAKQMDDDALAIINGTDLLVPGEEGMRDIRIVEAVSQSVTENRKVTI